MTGRFAQVALPLPLATPYTYGIPETLGDRVVPGTRVVVSVRRRELIGVAVDVDVERPVAEPKLVLAVPDAEPALSPELLSTAKWISGYYGTPLGLTLKAVLPAGMWGESQVVVTLENRSKTFGGVAGDLLSWLQQRGGHASVQTAARAFKRPLWDVLERLVRVDAVTLRVHPPDVDAAVLTERTLVLTGDRPTLIERDLLFKRRPKQRQLYETLESLGGSASIRHLSDQLGFGDGVVRSLVRQQLARIGTVELVRDPFADSPLTPPPPTLNPDQEAALAAITELGAGQGALLFGVTGSGKTLVYLEAVRRVLSSGQGAIVLVPEIGLTPQTVSRFRGAFGDEIAVLHSGLSEGERADAWRLLHRGERRVAVGARSAIFAPVARLGLIVIDEEHEASYKNGESPRYHARDVAAVRARLEGARLLLGSATPSLETFALTESKLRLLRLPQRVGARPLPPVEIVDLRTAPKVEGTGAVSWSQALDGAIEATLAREEQALLLLNRRGYAAFLQCPDCGEVWQCSRCSISLTVHQSPPGLRCHYCGHEEPLPLTCRVCANPVQHMRGIGTQQLERMLLERYPTARIARMDLDTTSTKWSHQRILGAVEQGTVDLLIGTQMIAKGLDFPKGGRVLIQTRHPTHHALVWAAQHDTDGFLREEGAQRETPAYPPMAALVNLIYSGPEEREVSRRTASLADWCTGLIRKHALPIAVLGPAPCPLVRLKDRWRWHVLLRGPSESLGRVVRYAARRLKREGATRLVIDRDPVSLL
jgi:primosomal protein N' (replication factor Y)